MQFKEGTTVYTSNGDAVGTIERFVLDPSSRQIVGLVIRKGFLFTEDKIVPVSAIASATADRVTLNHFEGGADEFPPFEQTHYVSTDQSEVEGQYQQPFIDPLYYYPPAGTMMWYGTQFAYPAPPAVKERNIPENTVPLGEGVSVVSRDGDRVGDIKQVFTDEQSRKVTHVAVSQGFLFKEEKVIPANWIDNISEDEVRLAVGTKQLERLGVL